MWDSDKSTYFESWKYPAAGFANYNDLYWAVYSEIVWGSDLDYDALNQQITERMAEILEEHAPELRALLGIPEPEPSADTEQPEEIEAETEVEQSEEIEAETESESIEESDAEDQTEIKETEAADSEADSVDEESEVASEEEAATEEGETTEEEEP